MSENRRKIISEDALEQVTGGVLRTVNTGTSDKAVVRSGPSTGKRQIASLANGVQVDTIGDPVYDGALRCGKPCFCSRKPIREKPAATGRMPTASLKNNRRLPAGGAPLRMIAPKMTKRLPEDLQTEGRPTGACRFNML